MYFTGDTLDRGGCPKGYENVETFFKKLLSTLKLDQEQLQIVPGNHDISRNYIISSFFESAAQEDFEEKNKYEEQWEILGTRFNKYNNFSRKISNEDKNSEGQFGGAIKSIELKQGIIRFVLLNSAWASIGDKDYGNLRIGRWHY